MFIRTQNHFEMKFLRVIALLFALWIDATIRAQTPSVFYCAEFPNSIRTIGVIENFDSTKRRTVVENVEKNITGESSVIGAEPIVERKSGRFAVFLTSGGFEQFKFASKQNHIVFGDVKSGLKDFMPADKTCQEEKMKCFESPLRFSNDGKKVFAIAHFSNRSVINLYDLESKSLLKDVGGKPKGKETRNVILSDDEMHVATTMNGDKRIYLKRIADKAPPKAAFQATEEVQLLFMNGEQLVYAKTIDGGVYKNDQSGNFREICVLNLTTKEEKSVFKFESTHTLIPSYELRRSLAFDRKNNRLYFVVFKKNYKETGDLYGLDLGTMRTKKIASDCDDVFDVSSDGKFALCVLRVGDAIDVPDGKTIRVINLENQSVQTFTFLNCLAIKSLGFYE